MQGTRLRVALFAVGLLVVPSLAQGQGQDMRECDLTITGKLALPDAGGLFYRRVGLVPEYATTPDGPEWRIVGLYGNGETSRPAAHEAAGIAIGQTIQPIDGKIVMISVGMSNTFQSFGRFRSRAQTSPYVNPQLVIVNAAQGGQPADVWDMPDDDVWDVVDQRLAQQGLTPDQVQIAWVKHAVRSPQFPPLDFPEHPETLQAILEGVITSLKTNYPNVKLAYLSSRTRAYNSNPSVQSPEPASYEGGFAVQWMIDKQIQGDAGLRYDGADPVAPWLSWGPYLWTDGTGALENDPAEPFAARSDGFVWTCADVQDDGVHPSPPTPGPGAPHGEYKTGDQLMAFFKTDPTTTPWFLRSTPGGPTLTTLTANGQEMIGGGSIGGQAPFAVAFSVAATGPVDEIAWTYDDGTFSYNPDGNSSGVPYFDDLATPTKVFRSAGTFDVRVSVTDPAGNATTTGFEVVVQGLEVCTGDVAIRVSRGAGVTHAELRWCGEPTASSYNVYRGTLPDLGDLACWMPGVLGTTVTDTEALPAGALKVYLVTFESGGAESSLGSASDGDERVNVAPCS